MVERFGDSALVSGRLGTPEDVNLKNAHGLPIGGIDGLGSGVAAALAIAPNANGGFGTVYRRAIADANTTVLATDRMLVYTSLTAARTVTLCAAGAYPTGTVLWIVDESAACTRTLSITIARAGSDLIEGRTTASIGAVNGYIALESDGVSKWKIIAQSTSAPLRVNLDDFIAPGVSDHTAAIQAWFDYIQSLLGTSELPPTGGVIGVISPKQYIASGGLVLNVTKWNLHIEGSGRLSRLHNVEFNVTGRYFQLHDLSLTGSTNVSNGIRFGSGSAHARCDKLYIRDRSNGILLDGSAFHHITSSLISGNEIGMNIAGSSTNNIHDCTIRENSVGGILFQGGGELKVSNCLVNENGEYGLKIAQSGIIVNDTEVLVNESYYNHTTITENGANTDAVTSIATHSGGSRILVTTSAVNELTRGLGKVKLTGTGVGAYDNVLTYIYDVLSPTEVVLDIPYVSDATGTLNSPGWDVIFEGDALNDNRSQYFTGGNINTLKVNCAHGVQFNGTRLKHRIWLGSATRTSQISFVNVLPDSQYGTGDEDRPTSEAVKEIPISGPGAVTGWTQLITTQIGKASLSPGGELIAFRAPAAGTPLKADRTAETINEVRVGTAGTFINGYPSDVEFVLVDDSAAFYTIPNGRLAAVVDVMVHSTSGEPYLTFSGQFACAAGSSPGTAKRGGGSSVDAITAGGALSGTTGTDGHVSVSAQTGGRIYVENRTGSSRLFRLRYVN
jgi:parallel beta-helix repeat protein